MKWMMPLVASLYVGCGSPEAPLPGSFTPAGDVEVTVNGQNITNDMLESLIRHMPKKQREELLNNPEQKKKFVDSYVTTEILYQKAIETKMHENDDYSKALAMANRHILGNMYLTKIGEDAVTDEAIQTMYDENKVKYGRPSTRLKHFMVKEQDLAQKLVAEINGGADFGAVARKHDRRAMMTGGDMGWVSRAPIPELESTLKEGALNVAIGPIESRVGFHVVKIMERRDKTPLEEVRDELAQRVAAEARKSFQTSAKDGANIVFPNAASPTSPKSDATETPSDAPAAPGHEGHGH